MTDGIRAALTALVLAVAAPSPAALPFFPADVNLVEPIPQPLVSVDPLVNVFALALDTKRGFAYATLSGAPGAVVKLRLATTTSPLAIVGRLDFTAPDGPTLGLILDPERGFGIVACAAAPTRLVKFTVDDTAAPPVRLDTLDLLPGELGFLTGGYDEGTGFAYFTAFGVTPARVAKVAAGSITTPMTRIAVTDFAAGDTGGAGVAVDPGSGRGWIGGPDRLIQFALGDGAAPPIRQSHAASPYSLQSGVTFHPMTRQIITGPASSGAFLIYDVSGVAPLLQNLVVDIDALAQPAIDTGSGLVYMGLAGGRQGLAKFVLDGSKALPGRVPGPAATPTDFLLTVTAVDPYRGFVYGTGIGVAGSVMVAFRQDPAPSPDLNGYVNRLRVRGNVSRTNVRAQLVVFNTGSADAGPFLVRTFLSSDSRLSYDDTEIGKPRRVRRLAAGKFRRLAAGGQFSGAAEGKFLIAVLDGEKSIGDGNYGDNIIVSSRL